LKILRDNSGVAILVTLTFIAMAFTASVELSRGVRMSVFQTATIRDKVTASYMSSSGVNAGMAVLIKDRSESGESVDSLMENWADPDYLASVINSIPFERGSVSVVIEDELSKIQVNALVEFPGGRKFNTKQKNVWTNFLTRFVLLDESFAEIEPISIINAAKDWLDSGDDDAITGLTGAESEYYQDMIPPYLCGNGPFRDINELGLVKDFTSELLYGAGDITGILNYMTVSGIANAGNSFKYPGNININTAELPVIAAIVPGDRLDAAEAIFDFRETIDEDNAPTLGDLKWYKNAPGCSDLDIDSSLICIASDTFKITATSKLNEIESVSVAVVKREKSAETNEWGCRVLHWETR
jgi:general secretion pathway protein K